MRGRILAWFFCALVDIAGVASAHHGLIRRDSRERYLDPPLASECRQSDMIRQPPEMRAEATHRVLTAETAGNGMAEETIQDQIEQTAAGAKKVMVDGTLTEAQPIKDLIAADKHTAAKEAVGTSGSRTLPIAYAKIRPGSTLS
jgi:hypothetical protein